MIPVRAPAQTKLRVVNLSDSEVAHAEELVAKTTGIGRHPARESSEHIYQHSGLKTLHLGKRGNDDLLACGRASVSFVRLLAAPKFDWHRCQTCFGKCDEPEVAPKEEL